MKKSTRIEIAKSTLKICEQGFYLNSQQQKVTVKDVMSHCIASSILYKPEDFRTVTGQVQAISKKTQHNTLFEVWETSTLQAACQLTHEGLTDIACLNFASAKNPGGGFLNGSEAQEESLARSSGLYLCLVNNMNMYHTNRLHDSCLYTDQLIYSPDVPVIKDDEGNLLDNFYKISIITSPAVNAGVVINKEPENVERIEPVMMSRTEKVLSVACLHGHQTLILGAWGCGVFKNEPRDVANYFASHLLEGAFNNVFKRVIFAIKSKDEKLKEPFKKLFGKH